MNSTQTASSQLLYTRNSKQSHQLEDSHPAGWTSFFFEDGESALVKLLAEQYKAWLRADVASPSLRPAPRQKRFLGIERSCRAATWAASLSREVFRFAKTKRCSLCLLCLLSWALNGGC